MRSGFNRVLGGVSWAYNKSGPLVLHSGLVSIVFLILPIYFFVLKIILKNKLFFNFFILN